MKHQNLIKNILIEARSDVLRELHTYKSKTIQDYDSKRLAELNMILEDNFNTEPETLEQYERGLVGVKRA